MDALTLSSFNEEFNLHAVFEETEHAAYGYLIRPGKAISMVWIYNKKPAPTDADEYWKTLSDDRAALNPLEFCSTTLIHPIEKEDEVSFEWGFDADSGEPLVAIRIRGPIVAMMRPSERIGRSISVTKDGPFAKPLELRSWKNRPEDPTS